MWSTDSHIKNYKLKKVYWCKDGCLVIDVSGQFRTTFIQFVGDGKFVEDALKRGGFKQNIHADLCG